MNNCNYMWNLSFNSSSTLTRFCFRICNMKMKWVRRESWFCVLHKREKKEVRGEGREALTLQMVCQLHSNSKIQTGAVSFTCMLLWWWNFDFIIHRNFMNKYLFSHWVSGERSFLPHLTESHSVIHGLNRLVFSLFLSAEDIFGSRTWRTQCCTEKEGEGERVMAVRGRERITELPRQALCEIWGPGALWMAHAEWVPWRGDQAHWEQVTRGRECFCSTFGPLTHCPTSALAALKPNIFICDALKREGGAAVRIKSSSCWQLHLLLKGSYDRRTMSLRRPALGEGLSYVDTLGILQPSPLPSPLPSSLDTPELFLWPR